MDGHVIYSLVFEVVRGEVVVMMSEMPDVHDTRGEQILSGNFTWPARILGSCPALVYWDWKHSPPVRFEFFHFLVDIQPHTSRPGPVL